jgi:hypothetical protein
VSTKAAIDVEQVVGKEAKAHTIVSKSKNASTMWVNKEMKAAGVAYAAACKEAMAQVRALCMQ